MAANPVGTVIATTANPSPDDPKSPTDVVVYERVSEGETMKFIEPVTLKGPLFGPSGPDALAVSPQGDVYVAYTDAVGQAVIELARPSDKGYEFQTPLTLTGPYFGVRQIEAGADGTVVVSRTDGKGGGEVAAARWGDGEWTGLSKLTARGPSPSELSDWRVAVSVGPGLVTVADPDANLAGKDDEPTASGAVTVYGAPAAADPVGEWQELVQLTSPDSARRDFGRQLEMSDDGQYLLVSSLRKGEPEEPSAPEATLFVRGDDGDYAEVVTVPLPQESSPIALAQLTLDPGNAVLTVDAQARALVSYAPVELCAAPVDSDGDGIEDGLDACPLVPAGPWDFDGDGCPDDRAAIASALRVLLAARLGDLEAAATAANAKAVDRALIKVASIQTLGPKGDKGALERFAAAKDIAGKVRLLVAIGSLGKVRLLVAIGSLGKVKAVDTDEAQYDLAAAALTFTSVRVLEAAEKLGVDHPAVAYAEVLLAQAEAQLQAGDPGPAVSKTIEIDLVVTFAEGSS